MKFIWICGKTIQSVVEPGEITPEQLRAAGVTDESVLRINQQGDIEVRRPEGWDVVGGLLGDFESRLKRATGQEWAEN